MNTPKPRIRPKPDARRRQSDQSESPMRDAPSHPEHDPSVFTERDPGAGQRVAGRRLFHEDDCLR
ncbi:MAG: hypothetical protein ACREV7_03965 [Steroidobacteraceae bacterium]